MSLFQEPQRVAAARALATVVHAGQVRDHGTPALSHPAAVVRLLHAWGYDDPTLLAAGWLHDTVEDGSDPLAIQTAITIACGRDVKDLVGQLTKPWVATHRAPWPDEVDAYWAALRADPVASVLKWADRTANLADLPHAAPDKQRRYCTDTAAHFLDVSWDVPLPVRHTLQVAWEGVVAALPPPP